ncbi:MAG: molybdenum cofactor biosynthesis protein [Desulfobulbaceae bacterium A2]|nr:MAG: molybdenum cofactor biosynthesis protein [Desulfobulbaceae bacterium A2]
MTGSGRVWRAGVLTLSDKGSRGERNDTSGPLLREMLTAEGFEVTLSRILPDVREEIADCLRHWVDDATLDLVVTTGGTGLTPSDVTPEATRMVIEREVPGMAEAMRQASLLKTSRAMLSRAVVGTRGRCLIVNLPGSARAAQENLAVLLPVLDHALAKLQGDPDDCGV